VRTLAGLVLTLAALATSAGPASALPDEPDLVIDLPGTPSGSRVAPVFVDAYEDPGRLLYRFDAIIANEGGTLDLFRDPGDGGVRQAVWPGGEPTVDPAPDQLPPTDTWIAPRAGGSLEYAVERTHQHFHLSSAARYELRPEGGAARASEKVGFCLFDSAGPPRWFGYDTQGAAGETWCAFGNPMQSAVRMGLSPGAGDRYSAQHERQWVDITGLEPGPAVVRAEANPLRCILESDEANNTTSDARAIPGVRVAGRGGTTPSSVPLTVALAGTVVAPEIPARRARGCVPGQTTKSCYVWASATGPLDFKVVGEPRHGTVALAPGGGLAASATYTPAAGFVGEDSFTYTATDARGLTSRPATVRLAVTAPPAAAGATPPPAALAAPLTTAARARLTGIRVVRRRGRWRVLLRSSAPARLSGRLERRVRGRRTRKRLRSRRIDAGPAGVALGRLARGRYRLRLSVDGRRAGTAVFTVRIPRRF
jgi:hypothetical protein